MAQEIYMVGLTVRDVDKSAECYRQLGLAIPYDAAHGPRLDVLPGPRVKAAGRLVGTARAR